MSETTYPPYITTGLTPETNAPEAAPEESPAAPVHHFLLPLNLACLAKLASKENPRYAIMGPRLTRTEGGYRVDVTDGRKLAIVTGPDPENPADYPAVPALATAPNGETSAIIPAKQWEAAFKTARVCGRTKPILGNVAVVLGKDVTTFVSTDLDTANVLSPRNVEGRYPDVDQVHPAGEWTARVKIDPEYLIQIATAARAFTDEANNKAIELEIRMPERTEEERQARIGPDGKSTDSSVVPVIVRAKNCSGQKFTGFLMPLG